MAEPCKDILNLDNFDVLWRNIDEKFMRKTDQTIPTRVAMVYKTYPGDETHVIPGKPVGGSWDPNTNDITMPVNDNSDIDKDKYTWGELDGLTPPIWMSQKIFATEPIMETPWSTPVRISGENGSSGTDGTNIEFIYKRTDRSSNQPSKPDTNEKNVTGYVPIGWEDHPEGVTQEWKCEWVCFRKKSVDGDEWGDWSEPSIWSMWGENGMDGDGVEYVYCLTKKLDTAPDGGSLQWGVTVKPSIPAYALTEEFMNSEEYQERGAYLGKEFIPTYARKDDYNEELPSYMATDWTDDPSEVDSNNICCWVSTRKRRYNAATEVSTWGAWSDPVVWAKWGENGQDANFIRYKYQCTTESGENLVVDRDNDDPGSLWMDNMSEPEGGESLWMIMVEWDPVNNTRVVGKLWSGPYFCTSSQVASKPNFTVRVYSPIVSDLTPIQPHNTPEMDYDETFGDGKESFNEVSGEQISEWSLFLGKQVDENGKIIVWYVCEGLVNGVTRKIQWGEMSRYTAIDGVSAPGRYTEYRFKATMSEGSVPTRDGLVDSDGAPVWNPIGWTTGAPTIDVGEVKTFDTWELFIEAVGNGSAIKGDKIVFNKDLAVEINGNTKTFYSSEVYELTDGDDVSMSDGGKYGLLKINKIIWQIWAVKEPGADNDSGTFPTVTINGGTSSGWQGPFRITGERGESIIGEPGVSGVPGVSYEQLYVLGGLEFKIDNAAWDKTYAQYPEDGVKVTLANSKSLLMGAPLNFLDTPPAPTAENPYIYCTQCKVVSEYDEEAKEYVEYNDTGWCYPFRRNGLNASDDPGSLTIYPVLDNPMDTIPCGTDNDPVGNGSLGLKTTAHVYKGTTEMTIKSISIKDAGDYFTVGEDGVTSSDYTITGSTMVINKLKSGLDDHIYIPVIITVDVNETEKTYTVIYNINKLYVGEKTIVLKLDNENINIPTDENGQLNDGLSVSTAAYVYIGSTTATFDITRITAKIPGSTDKVVFGGTDSNDDKYISIKDGDDNNKVITIGGDGSDGGLKNLNTLIKADDPYCEFIIDINVTYDNKTYTRSGAVRLVKVSGSDTITYELQVDAPVIAMNKAGDLKPDTLDVKVRKIKGSEQTTLKYNELNDMSIWYKLNSSKFIQIGDSNTYDSGIVLKNVSDIVSPIDIRLFSGGIDVTTDGYDGWRDKVTIPIVSDGFDARMLSVKASVDTLQFDEDGKLTNIESLNSDTVFCTLYENIGSETKVLTEVPAGYVYKYYIYYKNSNGTTRTLTGNYFDSTNGWSKALGDALEEMNNDLSNLIGISFELLFTGTSDGNPIVYDADTVLVMRPSEGEQGAMLYPAGEWSSTMTYVADEKVVPYVLYQGKYYYLGKTGESTNESPTDTNSPWVEMTQFDIVIAKAGVFGHALIGSAVFYDDWVFSQQGIVPESSPVVNSTDFNKFLNKLIKSGSNYYLMGNGESTGEVEITFSNGESGEDKREVTKKITIDRNAKTDNITESVESQSITKSDNIMMMSADSISTQTLIPEPRFINIKNNELNIGFDKNSGTKYVSFIASRGGLAISDINISVQSGSEDWLNAIFDANTSNNLICFTVKSNDTGLTRTGYVDVIFNDSSYQGRSVKYVFRIIQSPDSTVIESIENNGVSLRYNLNIDSYNISADKTPQTIPINYTLSSGSIGKLTYYGDDWIKAVLNNTADEKSIDIILNDNATGSTRTGKIEVDLYSDSLKAGDRDGCMITEVFTVTQSNVVEINKLAVSIPDSDENQNALQNIPTSGGDRKIDYTVSAGECSEIEITSKPDWITSIIADTENNNIIITASQNTTTSIRKGNIVFNFLDKNYSDNIITNSLYVTQLPKQPTISFPDETNQNVLEIPYTITSYDLTYEVDGGIKGLDTSKCIIIDSESSGPVDWIRFDFSDNNKDIIEGNNNTIHFIIDENDRSKNSRNAYITLEFQSDYNDDVYYTRSFTISQEGNPDANPDALNLELSDESYLPDLVTRNGYTVKVIYSITNGSIGDGGVSISEKPSWIDNINIDTTSDPNKIIINIPVSENTNKENRSGNIIIVVQDKSDSNKPIIKTISINQQGTKLIEDLDIDITDTISVTPDGGQIDIPYIVKSGEVKSISINKKPDWCEITSDISNNKLGFGIYAISVSGDPVGPDPSLKSHGDFLPNICFNFRTGAFWLGSGKIKYFPSTGGYDQTQINTIKYEDVKLDWNSVTDGDDAVNKLIDSNSNIVKSTTFEDYQARVKWTTDYLQTQINKIDQGTANVTIDSILGAYVDKNTSIEAEKIFTPNIIGLNSVFGNVYANNILGNAISGKVVQSLRMVTKIDNFDNDGNPIKNSKMTVVEYYPTYQLSGYTSRYRSEYYLKANTSETIKLQNGNPIIKDPNDPDDIDYCAKTTIPLKYDNGKWLVESNCYVFESNGNNSYQSSNVLKYAADYVYIDLDASNDTNYTWRIKQDGSGFLANQNISWTPSGKIEIKGGIIGQGDGDEVGLWKYIQVQDGVDYMVNKSETVKFNADGSGELGKIEDNKIIWDSYGKVTLPSATIGTLSTLYGAPGYNKNDFKVTDNNLTYDGEIPSITIPYLTITGNELKGYNKYNELNLVVTGDSYDKISSSVENLTITNSPTSITWNDVTINPGSGDMTNIDGRGYIYSICYLGNTTIDKKDSGSGNHINSTNFIYTPFINKSFSSRIRLKASSQSITQNSFEVSLTSTYYLIATDSKIDTNLTGFADNSVSWLPGSKNTTLCELYTQFNTIYPATSSSGDMANIPLNEYVKGNSSMAMSFIDKSLTNTHILDSITRYFYIVFESFIDPGEDGGKEYSITSTQLSMPSIDNTTISHKIGAIYNQGYLANNGLGYYINSNNYFEANNSESILMYGNNGLKINESGIYIRAFNNVSYAWSRLNIEKMKEMGLLS